MGQPPPPRGTIAHPRSSPTAQPLEQHGLGRARYPILAHYGRIAPRRRRTPHPLPAATRPATQPHIAHTRPGPERRVATDSSHFVTSSLRPLRQRRAATDSSHFVSLRHFVHFVTSACRITWSAMNLLHRRMPNATALADFAMPRCPFTRGVHSRRARCALRRPATASVAGGERHEQLLVTDHLPVDDLDGVTRRQA